MKLRKKIILLFLVLVLIIPFLIPVNPVEGTVQPWDLADADSEFTIINGISVHYKSAGQGERALVLLHGFGASVFSWRDVLEPLAQGRRVIAFDRPAFGLTERPMNWEKTNPYSPQAQVDLTIALLDEMGIDKAILVGHSAGAGVAVNTALEHPDRVEGLVLVAPALGGGAPRWFRPLLKLPQVRRLGPLFVRSIASRGVDIVRSSWHDQDTLTEEVLAGYQRPLKANNWDRALWEFTLASENLDLHSRLKELLMPVMVLTGDDDQIVPPESSEEIARQLAVKLVIFTNSGHLPHEEYPDKFIRAVEEFIEVIEDQLSCPPS